MSASKLKSVAALLFVALLVGGGLAHLSGQQKDARNATGAPKKAPMNAANPVKPSEDWSKAVNGLQARVVLVEKPRSNGTRMLHPYLELRNVDDMTFPLKVRLGGAHVKFALVDAEGKLVDAGQSLDRSGPHPDPGTISLPLDSILRVGMHCTNWGIPRDAAAMIATDSGAWVLKPEQKGKVFLRATVSGKKDADERVWTGKLEAKVRVTWSGDEAKPEEPKPPVSWADLLHPQEVAAGQFEKWKRRLRRIENDDRRVHVHAGRVRQEGVLGGGRPLRRWGRVQEHRGLRPEEGRVLRAGSGGRLEPGRVARRELRSEVRDVGTA